MFVMPWKPQYTENEARATLSEATTWRQALEALGLNYHGKNIATLRKWALLWGIQVGHLSDNRGARRSRYSREELAEAVAASLSWAETLRRLGYCPTGGNWRTLKKRTAEFGISTAHFDPTAAMRRAQRSRPLEEILVKGSTYSRSNLKRRLYATGLKERRCELCGQNERWRGALMSLILDHINGIRDDHRLENLRIICPNCAATLDTHCGRKNRVRFAARRCAACDASFEPKYRSQRYCSRRCGTRASTRTPPPRPKRKIERPTREQLVAEIDQLGYSAVGRKYGVSDNAVRKWIRSYERERAIAEGRDAEVVEIPRRTWPNRRRDRDAA
jgi:transposase-like protein